MEHRHAANILKAHNRILVTTQAYPNGDQIAATLGITYFLKNLGKQAAYAFEGRTPAAFSFLPLDPSLAATLSAPRDFYLHLELKEGAATPSLSYERNGEQLIIMLSDASRLAREQVEARRAPLPFDLLVFIGCPGKEYAGGILAQAPDIFSALPIVNIDHRAENTRFGGVNVIDLTTPSCCEVAYDILEAVSSEHIDETVATCLLAGILSATKNFRHARTNPRTFLRAANLVARGADREHIVKSFWHSRSIEHLKKLAEVLRNIEIVEPGYLGIITLDRLRHPFTDESLAELTHIGTTLLEEVLPALLTLAFIWPKEDGYAALLLSERRHILDHIATKFPARITGHALVAEHLPEHPKTLLGSLSRS